MNCPYCGWDLKITKEWVDSDGYHGIMVCNSMTGCEVTLNATTNLLWAYECGKLPKELAKEANSILLKSGLLPTPP